MDPRYTDDHFMDMIISDLPTLIAITLEDRADQVDRLKAMGDHEFADFLAKEGLTISNSMEKGEPFLFMAPISR